MKSNWSQKILSLMLCLCMVVGCVYAPASAAQGNIIIGSSSSSGSSGSSDKCANGHTFGDWTTVKDATCVADGERKHTCSVCGESVSEAIFAKGHVIGADGTCTVCGKGETDWSTCEHGTYSINGFCLDCGMGYEPAKTDSDGAYLIDNAGKLYWLAQQVAGGKKFSGETVKLTADITVNPGTFDENGNYTAKNGENVRVWTPIGNWTSRFCGTFDGAGHTVSGLYYSGADEYVGLFGCVDGGTVKNVAVKNAYFYSSEEMAGIGGVVGWSMNGGAISGCMSEATVAGSNRYAYIGGVVGYLGIASTMNSCYGIGKVSGISSYVSGVLGRNYQSTATNCFYLDTCGAQGEGTSVTEAQLASGEVTWKLNGEKAEGVWKQTIGTDKYPNFTGGTVYYVQYCDDTYAYANSAATHAYDNGFCSVCGGFEEPTKNGDVYEIDNAGKLYWFAAKVNSGDTKINAKLTDDIVVNANVLGEDGNLVSDTSGFRAWTPIGNSDNSYEGTFDGDGKTISGLYFNNSSTAYVGLFGKAHAGKVQNVGVEDSYFYGRYYVGGVVGAAFSSTTVTNCYNTGTVSGSGQCVGGVVGVASSNATVTNCYNTGTVSGSSQCVGGVVGQNSGTVTNCYNTGKVTNNSTVDGTGGVVGWNERTVTNCYNTGDVSGYYDVGGVVGVNSGATITNCYNTGKVSGDYEIGGVAGYNNKTITDCYYLTGCATDGNGTSQNGIGNTNKGSVTDDVAGQTEGATEAQFASGEVAYKLNAGQDTTVWYQGKGAPAFKGDEVSLVDGAYVLTHKAFVNGFCTVCDAYEAPTLNNGVYEIDNAGKLYWFVALVNGTLTDGTEQNVFANAKLTDDITVNKDVLKADGSLNGDGSNFRAWTPIGDPLVGTYGGTFDGDGHTISGLYVNESTVNYIGLFGIIGTGAIVKNVGVVDSYFCGQYYVGGVAGGYEGTVENCYNAAVVIGSAFVGGIVGAGDSGTVKNCYNIGTVSGTDEYVGGVVGYHGDGTVTNCYYLGAEETDDIDGTTAVTAAQLAEAELTWLLNGEKADGVWKLTIGTDKYPNFTGKTVYYGYRDCGDANPLYANVPTTATRPAHKFTDASNGFCSVCEGAFHEPEKDANGVYQIKTAGELYWFAALVNGTLEGVERDVAANAKLANDIVVNRDVLNADGTLVADPSNFRAWTPIAQNNSGDYYDGTFDGAGHSISGLYYNDKNKDMVGLFGRVAEGTVKNVTVKDSYFCGRTDVAGIAGASRYGTIVGCANFATVVGSFMNAAGIVGNGEYNTIQNCFNAGAISGGGYVGGIVGQSLQGSIQNCYNIGSIASESNSGPIIAGSNGVAVKNCYYLAASEADNANGATAMSADDFASGKVAYLLNGGDADGVWKQNLGTNGDKSPNFTSDGKVYAGYTSCGDTEYRYANTAFTYTEEPPAHAFDDNGFCVNCTNGYYPAKYRFGVYEIRIAGQLYWFAQQVNNGNTDICGKLVADIVVNGNVLDASGELNDGTFRAWTPIGSEYFYNGTFDGNGKTISGLYINANDDELVDVGLFGIVDGATVKNVSVKDTYFAVSGAEFVNLGGIVGYANTGFSGAVTIENCAFSGVISVSLVGNYPYAQVGGIVGQADAGDKALTIQNCTNSGTITVTVDEATGYSSINVGGVVGETCKNDGTLKITNCANSGSLTATVNAESAAAHVGGVVGYSRGEIQNCGNTGALTVESSDEASVGGVTGHTESTISNCFNTGAITVTTGGEYAYVGGVVGYNSRGTVENCYNTFAPLVWTTDTIYAGGLIGGNDQGTLNNCYYLNTIAVGAVGIGSGDLTKVEAMTATDFASGAVAWLLNGEKTEGVWKQNLGKNGSAYPNFTDEGKVYCGYFVCGDEKSYGNTEPSETPLTHDFTDNNGFCKFCDGYETPAQDNDGYYLIDNAGKLYWFAAHVNESDNNKKANAKLTADITVNKGVLTEDGTLNGDGNDLRTWLPILTYQGTFDGQDHTISGLYYSSDTDYYVGLFGRVFDGTLQNIHIVDSYFYGRESVGGIVGLAEAQSGNVTITNCSNAGYVGGKTQYVGGVVGQVGLSEGRTLTIENCYNTGNVSGNKMVGGVVGDVYLTASNATVYIRNCHNTGTISGTETYVGGVVGEAENYGSGTTLTIEKCYNTGKVSSTDDHVGGIAGSCESTTITNCYNTGAVSAAYYAGGVAGSCGSTTITNCYSTGAVSGNVSGGIVGHCLTGAIENCYFLNSSADKGIGIDIGSNETTAMSKTDFESGKVAYLLNGDQTTIVFKQNLGANADPLPNFTGATVYYVEPCDGGEYVYANSENKAHTYVNGFCACGDYEAPQTDADGVYLIDNAGKLYWFANHVNSGNTAIHGKLTADITVNSGVLSGDGSLNGTPERTWTPIGNESNPYTGTFDGNGKTISGLYFENTNQKYVGLFGYIGESVGGVIKATIKNITVKDSYFYGQYYVGGIVGYNCNSNVENCHNFATVQATGEKAGGIAGFSGGTVSDCTNSGTVSGKYDVGGIVGNCNSDSNITGCTNHGNVSSTSGTVGGVVGYNYRGNVKDCGNTANANITGTTGEVGGVVGSNNGTLENVYNAGTVSGEGKYVGGVCGYNTGELIKNVYNTGKVTGTDYVGGVVGYNSGFSSKVTNGFNTGTVTGTGEYVGGVVGKNSSTVKNCYYLEDGELTGIGSGDGKVTAMSATDFASGKVTWLLNGSTAEGVWKQNLAENGDKTPVLTGESIVYFGYTSCADKEASYANTALESKKPAHAYNGKIQYLENETHCEVCDACGEPKEGTTEDCLYDNGFCLVCGTEHVHTDFENGFCTCGLCEKPALKNGYYEIDNASKLYWFAQYVNAGNTTANAKLTADIVVNVGTFDAEGNFTSTEESARVWNPIGGEIYVDGETVYIEYAGTFDGDGHSISGLFFQNASDYIGLFGIIGEHVDENNKSTVATIKNVTVKNSYLEGAQYVGAIVGCSFGGTIENCHNDSTFVVSQPRHGLDENENDIEVGGYVGGIVGWSSGTVSKCNNSGTINVKTSTYQVGDYVGGIVGCNFGGGTVTGCNNTGAVTSAGRYVGGIVGWNKGTVSTCTNTATVTSTGAFIGGIVGANDGNVTRCMNFGNINASQTAGGIAGKNNGTVKECGNTGNVTGTGSSYYFGGVVGFNERGTVASCFNKGDVYAGHNCGGVVGINDGGTVKNCYYKERCATIGGTPQCGIGGTNDDETGVVRAIREEDFASGKLAYLLNGGKTDGIWKQTIGEESLPNFTGKTVYSYVDCSTGDSYANEVHADGEHGAFDSNGFCPCGQICQPCEGDGTAEKPYLIKNTGNLYWFMGKVNGGEKSIHGKLMADIVVNPGVLRADGELNEETIYKFRVWTPIGNSDKQYVGTFDGNGHSISGLYYSNDKGSNVGLIGYLGEGGTVKNVTIRDSYFYAGSGYVGSAVGYNNGTVSNCHNYGSIKTYAGSAIGGVVGRNNGGLVTGCSNSGSVVCTGASENCGGVVGVNSVNGMVTNCVNTESGLVRGHYAVGGVVGENYDGTVENCYGIGTVEGYSQVGGVVGDNYTGTVKNCYGAGTVASGGSGGGVIGKNESDGTVENCYSLDGDAIGNNEGTATKVESKGEDDFRSGAVAWLLNGEQTEGVWKQNLGENGSAYPNFTDEGKVYRGYQYCDDTEYSYANAAFPEVRAHKTYDSDGFCVGCGSYQPATWDEAGGYYEIDNAGKLYWFAAKVNGGQRSIWGILTKDIVINAGVLNEDGTLKGDGSTLRAWTPIGTEGKSYSGIFDGDGHSISGLYVNGTDNYVGLFGSVNGYGTVKNLTVKDSYLSGGENVGGVAGYNMGTLENCHNFGTVSGTKCVGGVVGYNIYGNIQKCSNGGKVSGSENVGGIAGDHTNGAIENCYNTGDILGDAYVGGVAGVVYGSSATVKNCFSTGKVTGKDDFGNVIGLTDSDSKVENCYYLADAKKDDGGMTAADFASGAVAWLLNGKKGGEDVVWKQTLGTDGTPNFTSKDIVYYGYFTCKDESPVYTNDKTVSSEKITHKYENGFCTLVEGETHLEPCEQENGVYLIQNAGNFFWFANLVNGGEYGASAKLAFHIDLESLAWTPIGTADHPYTGTFDGDGRTIEGLKITATSNNQGLFGVISGATVKNFTVKGKIDIAANIYNIGGVVGHAIGKATIEGITAEVDITDVRTDATDRAGTIGGIVGSLDIGSTVNRCVNRGDITFANGQVQNVGGVVGSAGSTTNTANCPITYCENYGNVTVGGTNAAHIGGILGGAGDSGAIISYCINHGNVTSSGTDCIGGIAAYVKENSKIEYCGNLGTITCTADDDGFIGGILGYINNTAFLGISNCFNYGSIVTNEGKAGNAGAILGRNKSSGNVYSNNYYLESSCTRSTGSGNTIGDAYSVTKTQFESGEVAYKLNGGVDAGAWKQTLPTDGAAGDTTPNFSGGDVYYGYEKCAEQKTYSNEPLLETPHNYDGDGFCTYRDGCYQPCEGEGTVEKPYLIGNAGQLFWFAQYVNAGHGDACAKLTADIDLENRAFTPIGRWSDYKPDSNDKVVYAGTFDGDYHVIKNLNVTVTSTYEAGLFSRTQDATLKNFGVINATITQSNATAIRAGVIAGEIHKSTVTNVFTAGEITITTSHDQKGGIAGESAESTLTNCFTTYGCLTAKNDKTTIVNCYYLADSANGDSLGTNLTQAEFESGALTWKLNGEKSDGVWKQTLDADGYPTFAGGTVYSYTNCVGNPAYANVAKESSSHHYVNGFCKFCNGYEQPELKDGHYLIDNAGKLYWFANHVNSGNTTANAKLTANITVNSDVLNKDGSLNGTPSRTWTPIGSYKKQYVGTFDGDGHSISGLYLEKANQDDIGLFGYVGENGTVKNVTVKDSCFCAGIYLGGIVGNNAGTVSNCVFFGTVDNSTAAVGGIVGRNGTKGVVENCHNSGTVKPHSGYAGGVIGYNGGIVQNCYNSGAVSGSEDVGGVVGYNDGTTKNCYNTGTVSGSEDVGGVVGDNIGTVENCYNTGAVSGSENVGGVVGCNIGEITNCYYLDSSADKGIGFGYGSGEATAMTDSDFASGAVTWLLNGSKADGVWKQTLAKDGTEGDKLPNFTSEDIVYGGYENCDETKDRTYSNSYLASERPSHSFDGDECTVCGKRDAIYVTITWEAMRFSYTDGEWDVEAMTWVGGGWSTEGDRVTIANNSNTDITATFAFVPNNAVTGFDDVKVEFGIGYTALSSNRLWIGGNKSVTITVMLTGKPSDFIEQMSTVGTITITLGEYKGG